MKPLLFLVPCILAYLLTGCAVRKTTVQPAFLSEPQVTACYGVGERKPGIFMVWLKSCASLEDVKKIVGCGHGSVCTIEPAGNIYVIQRFTSK